MTDNAPITRTLVVACCLFTIFFGIQGRSNKLGLSYQVCFIFTNVVTQDLIWAFDVCENLTKP